MAKVPPPTSFNYAANKRGPSTSLSGSSSEGENSDLEEIPPSPCSSTSSGPIYIRPAGFNHHAQEIQATPFRSSRSVKLKKKIKKNTVVADNPLYQQGIHVGIDRNNNCNNNNVRTAVPPNKIKQKPKKDPLPMKLRALPQSFWQQPNTVNTVPPGSMYTVLPPVSKTDQPALGDITDPRPVTPPSDSDEKDSKPVIKAEKIERTKGAEKSQLQDTAREGAAETVATEVVKPKQPKPPPRRIVRVSASSSNLLLKLFDGVENDKKSNVIPTVKRGRPKRDSSHPHHSKHVVGDDPFMIDAVADGLLPLLSIESNRQCIGPSSHLSVVSVKDGDKTLTLPSLNIEQNYPAMLSELVKAL